MTKLLFSWCSYKEAEVCTVLYSILSHGPSSHLQFPLKGWLRSMACKKSLSAGQAKGIEDAIGRVFFGGGGTEKKEKQIFLINKEIQMGSVAKS